MVKIRKYANVIERFLHGEKGQRFFNFAYSIGAAIVIWGALFKILHLPGGSLLLCIGMGTEIAMFILTAFDRPPKEYAWEEVFPVLDSKNAEDRPDFSAHPEVVVAGGAYPAGEYSEATAGIASVPAEGQTQGHTQGHTQGQTQGEGMLNCRNCPSCLKSRISQKFRANMWRRCRRLPSRWQHLTRRIPSICRI